MSGRIGMVCSTCGLYHNDPVHHRCRWVNPRAALRKRMTLQIQDQGHRCAHCRYELPLKRNKLAQHLANGTVVCLSCLKENTETQESGLVINDATEPAI